MKLKRIVLNNIRSYKYQEIIFPDGSTLLSGDIGSGKTSVLLGIEFALFGIQPGQRGSALLRNGEQEGGVKIEFEIDGKNIVIERTLKKKKTISQDYCAITVDGDKKEISVTELKNKVLEFLNYPMEFSKKQNLLYKFTVYTPQEEMKQIILQDAETRINTLRNVFGIDKYKRIIENTAILVSKIKEEKKLKEGVTMSLEGDKASLISKEDELETKHYNLESVARELFLKTEKRKKVQEEKTEISQKMEDKARFQQEIEKTRLVISGKQEASFNNSKRIGEVKGQIEELNKLLFDASEIQKLEEQIELKKKEKEELNESNLKITTQINSLQIKNEENEKVRQKIIDVEICPTCLQDVDPVYKTNVINTLESDSVDNNSRIQALKSEKNSLVNNISEIDAEISLKQKKFQDMIMVKVRLEEIGEKKNRMDELEKMNLSLEKDIGLLKQHIKILEQSVSDLKKFDSIFELKQKELEEALKQERSAEIKVAELKKEIDVFSRQIQELKERIKKTEEIRKQLHYLVELEDWLSKKFVPVISFIERNVMTKLKTEFSRLFAEWFGMLVSDIFNIQLRDDFTPVISYQDYEIEYSYLSGGERTAVALAYRLSLNQVINSILSKIKTKDIVILDEPTDGFSEQQLDKMRDVLQQLNVSQIIIVSHEQKMESFVENVIRFRKEGGVSRKEP